MYFSPLPSYFIPLRPKYAPQHLILKHPQLTFLPQCERPSFTPQGSNAVHKYRPRGSNLNSSCVHCTVVIKRRKWKEDRLGGTELYLITFHSFLLNTNYNWLAYAKVGAIVFRNAMLLNFKLPEIGQ